MDTIYFEYKLSWITDIHFVFDLQVHGSPMPPEAVVCTTTVSRRLS